ncbi:fibrous sheath CABYR-binding protein-like [Stomoxys calcitrans]|uniref:Uncharacterized protein n=1 Tax=Stomoxys calcitrans TaxID=35570 RepID=A0A1I8PKA1_STOCA|nr:fibrous sheath CABYR-binding protein-like [Stomoxys calcitrans]
MKFVLIALALLGAVAADVSHLSNEYLPPHEAEVNKEYLPPHMEALLSHNHVEYAEQTNEVPQEEEPAPVVEEAAEESASEFQQSYAADEPEDSSSNTVEEQAAPEPAPVDIPQSYESSASSGVETQYGENGGYVY